MLVRLLVVVKMGVELYPEIDLVVQGVVLSYLKLLVSVGVSMIMWSYHGMGMVNLSYRQVSYLSYYLNFSYSSSPLNCKSYLPRLKIPTVLMCRIHE